MEIRHCPRCELRFATEAEVRDHLVVDHGFDPEAVERRLPGWDSEKAEQRDAPDLVRPQPRRDDRTTTDEEPDSERRS